MIALININMSGQQKLLSEEYLSEQIQRRYFLQHVTRLVDLCYPVMAPNNQRLTENDMPSYLECLNKLNRGVLLIQQTSNSLSE